MAYKAGKFFKEKGKNCSGIIEMMWRLLTAFKRENENIYRPASIETTFFIILQG